MRTRSNRQRNQTSVILSLICTVLIGTSPLVAVPALAWWACPSGYQLEIRSSNNQHVRCERPADNNNINTNCPQVTLPGGAKVGAGFVEDYYSDGGDACVTQDPTGTAKTAVAHNFCPYSGYTHDKRNGRDRCHRPAQYTYPNRNV